MKLFSPKKPSFKYPGERAAMDGNTVELPVEQAKFGEYAADYQATLSILENRISGIRKALRGD